MTPLTRDADCISGSAITIPHARISNRVEVRRVTLETARHDRSTEIQRSISVAWAVYPTSDFSPIRNRQLEELIVLPVEISLALAA